MSHDEAAGVTAAGSGHYRTTGVAALVARYGLVIVIAWFGAMKFTHYEAQGISPLAPTAPS